MSEHPPSCTCNTLTEWNHFTSLVKGVVLDYVRISHSDDLPKMLSVAFKCSIKSVKVVTV